jgi:DNA-binding protein YbaB
MKASADDKPNLEQLTQLLKARKIENVTVSTRHATVTVSPQLELLSVTLTGPCVLAEHRDALQHDIVDAVNKAMREVVAASALMLEGLQELPEIQSIRDALQKQIGR